MKSRLLMAGLLVFGGWQLGQGSYLLAKAELAQNLLEQAWDEMRHYYQHPQASSDAHTPNKIHTHRKRSPWPWADTYPLAKLHWQSLDQSLIVLSGASGRNLAFGPAHMSASVVPGEQGVSVIGGHRDTHFAFLQQVVVGDYFDVELIDGSWHRFQVKEISITDVRKSRIALDSDESKIALVACYPFTDWQPGGALRYLVLAERISSKLLVSGEKTYGKVEQVPPTSSQMLTTMSL